MYNWRLMCYALNLMSTKFIVLKFHHLVLVHKVHDSIHNIASIVGDLQKQQKLEVCTLTTL